VAKVNFRLVSGAVEFQDSAEDGIVRAGSFRLRAGPASGCDLTANDITLQNHSRFRNDGDGLPLSFLIAPAENPNWKPDKSQTKDAPRELNNLSGASLRQFQKLPGKFRPGTLVFVFEKDKGVFPFLIANAVEPFLQIRFRILHASQA
jgi:hypothetical protein